jgi:hypothetical protein
MRTCALAEEEKGENGVSPSQRITVHFVLRVDLLQTTTGKRRVYCFFAASTLASADFLFASF